MKAICTSSGPEVGRPLAANSDIVAGKDPGRCVSGFENGRGHRPCLFLAYSVHQQAASLDTLEQLQATRNFLSKRRLSASEQQEATAGNRTQKASDSAVNRRVVGSVLPEEPKF